MNPSMNVPWHQVHLRETGVLRIRGADGVRFLQGQLSNDVTRLGPQRGLLAGYHNPQGRTIALLRLLLWEAEDILAIGPREIVAATAARLAKYVLRSKVKISDESALWHVGGAFRALVPGCPGHAQAPPAAAELPAATHSQQRSNDQLWVRIDESRLLLLTPEANTAVTTSGAAGAGVAGADAQALMAAWHSLAIAAGEPEVVASTSEAFVAQMLNLDVFDAIAFEKGCYTGQEVIARAHYRGRVKRRLQHFVTRQPVVLGPGDSAELDDGRTFRVVSAMQLADGRCEFLAVTAFARGDSTAGPDQQRDTEARDGASAAGARIAADPVPLPYALPE